MKIRNVAASIPPEVELNDLALISLEMDNESGQMVSLRTTMSVSSNGDAEVMSYPIAWKASWFEIASKGFWETWAEIGSKVSKKPTVQRGMSTMQAEFSVCLDRLPVISGSSVELAKLFVLLDPGVYLIECSR
jgi:hypothetical protein